MKLLSHWCSSKASLRMVIEFGCMPEDEFQLGLGLAARLDGGVRLRVGAGDGVDLAGEQRLHRGGIVLEAQDLEVELLLAFGEFAARRWSRG